MTPTSGNDIFLISTYGLHSLALKKDETVWAWGQDGSGQLGIGKAVLNPTVPIQVKGLSDMIGIAAGGEHSLAVKSDGTVWAWGRHDEGQLGVAMAQEGEYSYKDMPVQVQGLSGVIAVAAGENHSMALTGRGLVYVWGYNSSGQLGNGDFNDQEKPVRGLWP